MIIAENKVVYLHYSLRDGSENGELIEETYGQEPLAYLHGHGTMISGFEKNLQGLKLGDKYAFLLDPHEAYGEVNEENIVQVPIENFADENGKINRDLLEEGAPINMTDEEGNFFQGFIAEIKLDSVVVDFNHPMAGCTLHFSGEIIDIRDATAEEIAHSRVLDK